MKNRKKIFALALVLALMLSLGSLTAFADDDLRIGELVTDEQNNAEPVEWAGGADVFSNAGGRREALRIEATEVGVNAELMSSWSGGNGSDEDPIDAVSVHIIADGAPVNLTAEFVEGVVGVGKSTGLLIEVANGGSVTADVDELVVSSNGESHAVLIDNREGSASVLLHRPKIDTSSDYVIRGGGNTALIIDNEFPNGGLVFDDGALPEKLDVLYWKGSPSISYTAQADMAIWSGVEMNQFLDLIVRVEEAEGGSITVGGAEEKHGYITAHGYDELTVTAVPKEGWQAVSVFNNGEALEKDENGNYRLSVPMDGGLSLSGMFAEISAQDYPPAPKAPQAMTRVCFGSDGAESLTFWFFPGQRIVMPDAPARDGFRFVCWRTELNGEPVDLQPGESFQLNGWQDFTAVWEKA